MTTTPEKGAEEREQASEMPICTASGGGEATRMLIAGRRTSGSMPTEPLERSMNKAWLMGVGRGVKLTVVAAAATAALVAFACSATNDDNGFDGTGASGNVISSVGTDAISSSGALMLDGGSDSSSCGIHCSADLHQVLDCNENVISTCPDDQGCAPGGTCVAPCDSAAANASTIGCDFYSVVPGPEYETRGSCFAALLANTWTTPITIEASRGATQLNIAQIARTPEGSGQAISYSPLPNNELLPGKIAILFLSDFPSGDFLYVGCPAGISAGVQTDPAVDKTGIGQAFHIRTSAPVVAYDIYPYGGAASYVSSATLLVPTPTWGTNFIAADAYQTDPNLAFVNGYPFIQIVASEDATAVTISPTSAIVGGPGVVGTGQGQPVTYQVNRGEYLQILQNDRLSGSPISADKPISVWGGSACMNIPVGNYACDSAHQQLLPVQSLGREYLGVRHRDRSGTPESVPYQIVGAVDGTVLTYEPSVPLGAPTTLSSGQAVEFSSGDAFVVRSQDSDHPFYLAQYMTGAGLGGGDQGDPEFVNVIPPEQYLPEYLFLTDPTYRNTHLVFTRQKVVDGFRDVTLDCLGTVTGWAPIGTTGQFEYARVDLTMDFQPVGGCNTGVHTATSTAPFGLTVWGWDTTCSYAYPAGMSVEPINTVVVPPDPQ
jgi:IgGFc binding protein